MNIGETTVEINVTLDDLVMTMYALMEYRTYCAMQIDSATLSDDAKGHYQQEVDKVEQTLTRYISIWGELSSEVVGFFDSPDLEL